MNAVLAGIFAGIFTVPLHLTVEIGDREGFGKFHGVPMRKICSSKVGAI